MSSSSEENWDNEFDFENRPETPPRQALPIRPDSIMVESDDENWEEEFGVEPNAPEKPPPKLVGISSNVKETWEDDFDFGDEGDTKLEEPTSLPLAPSASRPTLPFPSKFERKPLARQASMSAKSDPTLESLKAGVNQLPDPRAEKEVLDFSNFLKNLLEVKGDDETRIPELEKKIKASAEAGDSIAEGLAYQELGSFAHARGRLVEAMAHFQAAIKLLESNHKHPQRYEYQCKLLYIMGMTEKQLANIFKQMEHLQRALEIQQKAKSPNLLLWAQINYELGLVFLKTEKPIISLKHFDTYLKLTVFGNCSKSKHVHSVTCLSPPYPWRQLAGVYLCISQCFEFLHDHPLFLDSFGLRDGYLDLAFEAALRVKDPECVELIERFRTSLGVRTPPPIDEAMRTPPKTPQIARKDGSSSDDEEDWDAEMGLDSSDDDWDTEFGLGSSTSLPEQQQQQPPPSGKVPRRRALFQTTKDPDDEVLPEKYKFIDTVVKKTALNIVKYPPPSYLYSLTTADGHAFMHEENLEQWLLNLVVKHAKHLDNPPLPLNELRTFFDRKLGKMEKFTYKWARTYLSFCYALYSLSNSTSQPACLELCWDSIHSYFLDLKDFNTSRKPKEKALIYHYSLKLLYLAGKLYKPEEDTVFGDMCKSLTAFEKDDALTVDVLHLSTLAHHNKELVKCLNGLADIAAIRGRQETPIGDKPYETGPLNTQSSALVAIHFIFDGMSPLNGGPHDGGSLEEEELDGELKDSPVFDVDHRIMVLLHNYPNLNTGLVKARAAYCLGSYYVQAGDHISAEKLLFECVYLLDTIKPCLKTLRPLITELGAAALAKYAEVLIHNYKYQYGILCFEAAFGNYNLRKKSSSRGHFGLLRRVAAIAREQGDLKRAIGYHIEILRKYRAANKTNEVIFVSDILSSLYLERGDFRLSEHFLKGAAALLPLGESRIDPQSFNLQLKLAALYLESYSLEKGIDALEKLNLSNLPSGKRSLLLSMLARAYIKKGWFTDCQRILERFQTTKEDNSSPRGVPVQTATLRQGYVVQSLEANAAMYHELSALNYYHSHRLREALHHIDHAISLTPESNLNQRGTLFYIRAKIFARLCSSSTSLTFPTTLRSKEEREREREKEEKPKPVHTGSTPPGSTNTVRKLDDTRRKIMTNHRRGPSSLGVDAFTASVVIYKSTGDLIQECVATFNRAYSYFKATSDDLKIAKCVAHIAEVYLERLFAPTALLSFPYEDLASLKAFQVSPLVRSANNDDPKDFYISFEKIEQPALLALEVTSSVGHVMLQLLNYLNMAELKYLQGKKELAMQYWTLCKDHILVLFVNGPTVVGPSTPCNFLHRLYRLVGRAVRFLFCFEADFINKNIMMLDIFLLLHYQVDAAERRDVAPGTTQGVSKPSRVDTLASFDESIYSSHEYARSQTLGRSFQEAKDRPSLEKAFAVNPPRQGNRRTSVSLTQGQVDAEDPEQTAERNWGYLHCIKTQLQKFASGKVDSEVVLTNNQASLQKIIKNMTAHRILTLQSQSGRQQPQQSRRSSFAFTSPQAYTFHQFQDFSRTIGSTVYGDLTRLFYLLNFEDYLICYVPSSGQKFINRVGGKEEAFVGVKGDAQLFVDIDILNKDGEAVSFVLEPDTTLTQLLETISRGRYEQEDKVPKKGLFGSVRGGKPAPVRFLKQTSNFRRELGHLTDMLKSSRGTVAAGLCFARKQHGQFHPLIQIMDRKITDIFSGSEVAANKESRPLKLYIFVSSAAENVGLTPRKEEGSINLTDSMIDHLRNLLEESALEEPRDPQELDERRALLTDMAKTVFPFLHSVLPNQHRSEIKSGTATLPRKDGFFHTIFKSGGLDFDDASTEPVVVLASKSLQLIPWESIMNQVVVRFFSLWDCIHKQQKDSRRPKERDPLFFSFYYGLTQNRAELETAKKRLLTDTHLYNLNILPQRPLLDRNAFKTSFFQSPLVRYGKSDRAYRKKYKIFKFIDLDQDRSNLSEIANRNADFQPIFVFSWSDLIEGSAVLTKLIRTEVSACVIFVPASDMKLVCATLVKAQEGRAGGKSQSLYQFLFSAISVLVRDLAIPIAVFNPPKLTDR